MCPHEKAADVSSNLCRYKIMRNIFGVLRLWGLDCQQIPPVASLWAFLPFLKKLIVTQEMSLELSAVRLLDFLALWASFGPGFLRWFFITEALLDSFKTRCEVWGRSRHSNLFYFLHVEMSRQWTGRRRNARVLLFVCSLGLYLLSHDLCCCAARQMPVNASLFFRSWDVFWWNLFKA